MIMVETPLESISRSNFKPNTNQNDRLVQIKMKVPDAGDDDFSL